MDTDDVAAQVMLATEGTTTSAVRANMGLQTVGVMSGHMGFEIVCTGEGCAGGSVRGETREIE